MDVIYESDILTIFKRIQTWVHQKPQFLFGLQFLRVKTLTSDLKHWSFSDDYRFITHETVIYLCGAFTFHL